MKILRAKYSRIVGSQFEALGVLGSKSWRKQTYIFFWKKWGSVFFMFLIWALLRPQIVIRRRFDISRVIFSCFWPLKSKYLEKNYLVIALTGFLTILAFKISKKLNFGFKIGISKMLFKNSVSSTHTATLEIWWYLIQKMTNLKKIKFFLPGLKLGSRSKLNLKLFGKLWILFILKILVS